MEPLQPGFVAYVDANDKFYIIGASEGLKYITNSGNASEFSALTTGQTSSTVAITALEPDDSPRHLYQIVFGFQDGEQYKFQAPSGISRLGPDQDRTSTYLTSKDSHRLDPNSDLTETWLVKYYFPAFIVYNSTPVTNTPRIWFYGKNYDIREITNAPLINSLRMALGGQAPAPMPFKRITIGGVKRTAGN